MRRLQVINKVFGRLTVKEEINERPPKLYCECSCGKSLVAYRNNVLAGYTKSCGCLHKERTSEANSTHGESGTRLYKLWKGMLARCSNPARDNYQYYGAKGIRVCQRWKDYALFYTDMGPSYVPGLQLDRVDPTKDYTPENCRWLTQSENAGRNKRHG